MSLAMRCAQTHVSSGMASVTDQPLIRPKALELTTPSRKTMAADRRVSWSTTPASQAFVQPTQCRSLSAKSSSAASIQTTRTAVTDSGSTMGQLAVSFALDGDGAVAGPPPSSGFPMAGEPTTGDAAPDVGAGCSALMARPTLLVQLQNVPSSAAHKQNIKEAKTGGRSAVAYNASWPWYSEKRDTKSSIFKVTVAYQADMIKASPKKAMSTRVLLSPGPDFNWVFLYHVSQFLPSSSRKNARNALASSLNLSSWYWYGLKIKGAPNHEMSTSAQEKNTQASAERASLGMPPAATTKARPTNNMAPS
mmetsp:Transcript_88964/g.251696  ORF Transcript_88964/g.251696 Transcript_88964/m.251696 type:complete len:307 (+) Transcript_88964:1047-1967(+)